MVEYSTEREEVVARVAPSSLFGGARRAPKRTSNKPPLNATAVWLTLAIVVVIGGATLVVAGLSIRSHHTPNAPYPHGVETTGTVVDAMRCDRYVIATDVVAFRVGTVTYTASSTDLCGAVGDRVTVSYLPRDPRTARVLVDQHLVDANAAIGIGALLIVGAGVGLVTLRTAARRAHSHDPSIATGQSEN